MKTHRPTKGRDRVCAQPARDHPYFLLSGPPYRPTGATYSLHPLHRSVIHPDRSQTLDPQHQSTSDRFLNSAANLELVSNYTFLHPDIHHLRLFHSAISTPDSQNPHGTALFCTVPRNENFLGSDQCRILSGLGASLAYGIWAPGHFSQMLTFPSQVPAFTIFTLKKYDHSIVCHLRKFIGASQKIRQPFPLCSSVAFLCELCATSPSPLRKLTFLSQVPAIINSNDLIYLAPIPAAANPSSRTRDIRFVPPGRIRIHS